MSKYPYQPQEQEYEEEYELPEDQDYGQQQLQMPQQYQSQQIQQSQQLQRQPQQAQQPFNPYYNGIRAAMAEARESFGASDEQKNRAMRAGILSFGQSLGGMEREKGFKNNLLAAGRALAPAISAYDISESQAEGSNEQLANKLIAEQQAHEARQLAQQNMLDDRALKMEMMAQNKDLSQMTLIERFRHHKALEDAQMQRMAMSQNNDVQNSELDAIAPRIRTDSAFDDVGKKTRAAAEFYNEAQEVKKKYEDLKQAMQKGGIDTTDPWVFRSSLRNIKGLISGMTKDPVGREIAQRYADVTASNKRMMQTAEKALKSGALTNFTVKYGDQNDLFPNFNENPDVYETKLDHLLKDAKKGYESSYLSLKQGRHVDQLNYDNLQNALGNNYSNQLEAEPRENTPSQEFVRVKNREGRTFKIPSELANEAVADGMEMINE